MSKLRNKLTRRSYLKTVAAGASTLCLPFDIPALRAYAAGKQPKPGDHFFMSIVFAGGWDSNYLFDARPLAMTQAGAIQNYLGEEPFQWEGRNGTKTLASPLVKPLLKFKDRMAVLNGVLMDSSFDGHEQNINFLYTGNPFGGEAFFPHINRDSRRFSDRSPLDAITSSSLRAPISNGNLSVALGYEDARKLVNKLQNSSAIKTDSANIQYALKKMSRVGQGTGDFSLGSKMLGEALNGSPKLADHVSNIKLPELSKGADTDIAFVKLTSQVFRNSLSRAVIQTIFPGPLDTHAASEARNQVKTYRTLVDKTKSILEELEATPWTESTNLLDHTTVMITSEFSRTLRQTGLAIDQTGTDHNPLTNTVLLLGKGIKGGQIIGGSDFMSADESLSKAHLQMDPEKLKSMGRPFDYTSMQVRTDQPEKFDIHDHLHFGSIINTIYEQFDIPKERYRLWGRNEAAIPTLKGVLKG